MNLLTLLKKCDTQNDVADYVSINITHMTQDYHQVKSGSLFICLERSEEDGHARIQQVIDAGAAAIIVERMPVLVKSPIIQVPDSRIALARIASCFFQEPSRNLTLFGVTGTKGTATVTSFIQQICHKLFMTVRPSIVDSLTTQQQLAQMVEQGVTGILDVTAQDLAQNHLLEVDFDVAVFTNLSPVQLDFHKSMAAYFLSTSRLFMQLTKDVSLKVKWAIINDDDPYGQQLQSFAQGIIFTYGCQGNGDFQAANINTHATGTDFDLIIFGHVWPLSVNLVGEETLYYLLAATAACFAAGVPLPLIIECLKTLVLPPPSLELFPINPMIHTSFSA